MANTYSSGTFSTLLFLVFLILKLTDTIEWSWWWVTAPLWLPAAILLIIGSIAILILAIQAALSKKRKSFYKK